MSEDKIEATSKTLRQLLEEAAVSVSLYEDWISDEFKRCLNDVLKAAGLGYAGEDRIIDITESLGFDGYFSIETEWYCRGNRFTREYRLPISIVDSPDPMHAARAWKYAKDLKQAEDEVMHCEVSLNCARAKLEKLQKEPFIFGNAGENRGN